MLLRADVGVHRMPTLMVNVASGVIALGFTPSRKTYMRSPNALQPETIEGDLLGHV